MIEHSQSVPAIEQLPPIYNWRIQSQESFYKERKHNTDLLNQVARDIITIHAWEKSLLADSGLSVETLENNFQHMRVGDLLSPDKSRLRELHAQHYHIRTVLGTTLELAAHMTMHDLPRRTIALQLGTGFPVLDNIPGVIERESTIHYGEKPLKNIPSPTVQGHKGAMHLYRVFSESEPMTLVLLEGRPHGYEMLHTPYAHHHLAIMPRVLKGVGTEMAILSFASGFDAVDTHGQSVAVGDYGIVFANSDLSGTGSILDPAAGDQTLLGRVFGGPFSATTDRTAHANYTHSFLQVFRSLSQHHSSTIHPALLFDAKSTPHFENGIDTALAQDAAARIIEYDMYPAHMDALFPQQNPIIAHGMSTAPELSAYYLMTPDTYGGVSTSFNRRIPVVPIVGATDLVDPRAGGDSHLISHEKVQEAGAKSSAFIKKVLTRYILSLAANPQP